MMNLLIIDDDPRNILALKAFLKSRGHDVRTASSMAEAFNLLKQHRFDIVLLDMMMPEIDGYQALPMLKNDDALREIPVVAVTAQAMKGDREKCLDAGADGYLSKPVDPDLLLETLQHYGMKS